MSSAARPLAGLPAPLLAWLQRQAGEVRVEIYRLLSYKPEGVIEFFDALQVHASVLPRSGLLDGLYDVWSCVPSALAFEIAAKRIQDPAELADYLVWAEHALLGPKQVAEFEELWHPDDPLDELYPWLRERAETGDIASIVAQMATRN